MSDHRLTLDNGTTVRLGWITDLMAEALLNKARFRKGQRKAVLPPVNAGPSSLKITETLAEISLSSSWSADDDLASAMNEDRYCDQRAWDEMKHYLSEEMRDRVIRALQL